MKKFLSILSALFIILNTCVVFAESDAEYKTLVEPKFDDAQFFSEGYAPVCVNGKWGYIDKTGKYLVEPKYDYASIFSEGKAVVGMFNEDYVEYGINGTCTVGFIDTTGKYTSLTAEKYLIDNLIRRYNEPISTDKTEVIPEIPILCCLFECDFEANIVKEPKLWAYTNGYLYIYEQNGDGSFYGYFDENGKMINPYIGFKPDYDSEAGERWCTAIFNGIYSDGLICAIPDYAGCETIDIYDINKNLQFSKLSTGYSGYKDAGIEGPFESLEDATEAKQKLDNLNIDYFYVRIYPFHDGYAGAWILKNEGAKIEQYNYTILGHKITEYNVGFFNYDYDYTALRFALIDKKGNVIFSGDYSGVNVCGFDEKVLNKDRIVLSNNANKFGAVDKNGDVKIPFEYEQIFAFSDTTTSAKKDGVWYQIDTDGKKIHKTDYDFISLQNHESKTSLVKKNGDFFVILDNKKISGSEKIASEKYYTDDLNAIAPDDTIITKDGDKYGYAMLDKVSVIDDYADKIDVKKHINNDTLTLSVNVKDNCEMPNLTMYLVSRNKNNGLYSIKTDKKSSSDDDTIELSVDISTSKSYKFMLWDDELQPLINPIE